MTPSRTPYDKERETVTRIAGHRWERGWSTGYLAQQSGVPEEEILAVEWGDRPLTVETLYALCQALGRDPRGIMPGPSLKLKGEVR